jgi:hypothetical protein
MAENDNTGAPGAGNEDLRVESATLLFELRLAIEAKHEGDRLLSTVPVQLDGATQMTFSDLLDEMRGCNDAARILGETEGLDMGLKNGLYFLHLEMDKRLSTLVEMLGMTKEVADD